MNKFFPIQNYDGLSPQTTKGDLAVYGAAGSTRLAVGANNTSPIADSTQALGIRWGAITASNTVNTLSGATTLPNVSQVVLVSGSTYPITLPSPTSNSGLEYRIINTNSAFGTTPISISGTGFVGVTLQTQYEEYTIICDGSTYWPLNHYAQTPWTALTVGFSGLGTVGTSFTFYGMRRGDTLDLRGEWINGTNAAAEARVNFPAPLTIGSSLATLEPCGSFITNQSLTGGFNMTMEPGKTYLTFTWSVATSSMAKLNGNAFNNAASMALKAYGIPMAGWGA